MNALGLPTPIWMASLCLSHAFQMFGHSLGRFRGVQAAEKKAQSIGGDAIQNGREITDHPGVSLGNHLSRSLFLFGSDPDKHGFNLPFLERRLGNVH